MVERSGDEVVVTPGSRDSAPASAVLADGRLVVVHGSIGDAPSSRGVYAQIYDPVSGPVGDPFLVNSLTTGEQGLPVVVAVEGGFVVAWQDGSGVTNPAVGMDIRAQRFDLDGNKVGAEVVVPTTVARDQTDPAITALDDGGYLLTWIDKSASQVFAGPQVVRGQRFDAAGAAVGAEFAVDASAGFAQLLPAASRLGDGFVVAYAEFGSAPDSADVGVRAQIFNAAGGKVGAELIVNTTAAGEQTDPAITELEGGGFVVVWREQSALLQPYVIKGRLYGADGTPASGELTLDTISPGLVVTPEVLALPGGGFVIAWEQGTAGEVFGREFDSAGAAVDERFPINTTPGGVFMTVTLSATADGFVAVWSTSQGEDGDTIRAQFFTAGPSGPTDGPDTLEGTGAADLLDGLGGADSINGLGGDDQLAGGDGDDTLDGGPGRDRLTGGAGEDTASYASAVSRVVVDLSLTTRQDTRGGGKDTLRGIENLEGSNAADALTGNGGANRLIGGLGADVLTGGLGPDVFAYRDVAESKGRAADRITDFAEGDRIDLAAIDANAGAADDQAFAFIGAARFSGIAGQLRAVVRDGDTVVTADIDGDRAADLQIVLSGVVSLSAADFVL